MLGRALIFVTFGGAAGFALAQDTEIYKCLDAAGKATYTNDKRGTSGMKCKLVARESNAVPGQKGKPAPPQELGRFPRETPAQAANAKGLQRQVLEKELATEQAALAKAKQDLAELQAVRTGAEDVLRPFRDSIQTHEKNIEALLRELSNLR